MSIDEFISILQVATGAQFDSITPSTNLVTDLYLSSFEMMSLIALSENATHRHFDIAHFMASFSVENFLSSLK